MKWWKKVGVVLLSQGVVAGKGLCCSRGRYRDHWKRLKAPVLHSFGSQPFMGVLCQGSTGFPAMKRSAMKDLTACLLGGKNLDEEIGLKSLSEQQRHHRLSVPTLNPSQENVQIVCIWLLLVTSFIIGVSVSCTAFYPMLFIKEGPVHFRDTMKKNTNIWSLSILYWIVLFVL